MTDLPNTSVVPPPPGWYPDPTGAPGLRWWNGSAWMQNTGSAAEPSASGALPYALQQASATVPAGTRVYNPLIWIMALLPIVGTVTLLTVNLSVLVRSSTDPFALYRDPGYLASVALSFVTYGAAVLLGYFDRKRLLRDGYDRPFHWAWAFLSSGVYVIGRSVVVKRRAGRGLAPMWLWIAIAAVVTITGFVWVGQMMASLLATIPFSA